MKILLVGEYSRLHNSLKEGLEKLGHEVMLVSTGDDFKQYPSDIILKRKYNKGFFKKIKILLYLILGYDISSASIKKQFFNRCAGFKNYDVVQLINESPFGILPFHEKAIFNFLKNNNHKLFLLSCGTDYPSVSFALSRKLPYSILTPYLDNEAPKKKFDFALKYITEPFRELHHYLYEHVQGVIASDLDYHLPLQGEKKYLGLIPNPINMEVLPFIELPIDGKVNVFLGINRGNYLTKGVFYFEESLALIQQKYKEKVHVTIVENLPYHEYIKSYDESHIILDQVYGLDQGYNALEAMAKGKVVFTGAEKEFLEYYRLNEDEVCINAIPNTNYLVEKLSELIENPKKIIEIGRKAREFIKEEHHYNAIAKKYIAVYKS